MRSVNMVVIRNKVKIPNITFTSVDFKGMDPKQDDPMVISFEVANCLVRKTLVDQGSSIEILFWNTFKQLDIPESMLQPHDGPLFGFVGKRVSTRGSKELLARFGTKKKGYVNVIV